MRKIEVKLDDILSLISCARQYGFEDDVLFTAFKEMIETLSDEEIEAHCQWYLSEEARSKGYGLEDYESIRERLTEFKMSYLNK